MPFYEYQCSACGAQVEVLQKISDAPLKKCPECGQNKLAKLVSAPVFRLKGGGWYETDFKSDKDSKRNLVDSDRDAPKETTAEKTDARPADQDKSVDKDSPAEKADSKAAAKTESKPADPGRKSARRPAKSVAKKSVRGKAKR
jgi:putative FmdB family regulatory protein